MPEHPRGTDRAGRRSKRLLSPSQKYEIWLQLVRGETTLADAAARWQVDRSTILRIRTVAKDGALAALAASRQEDPRTRPRARAAQGRERPAVRGGQGAGDQADAGGGKRQLGLSGRVPRRVDAATKAGLLALLDDAVDAGWPLRRACRQLELNETRAWRWLARRGRGQQVDQPPGGHPMHGILADEVAEIVAAFHEWGEVDRSHRKLAHRGSYLHRVWVSPSTVRRVLAAQGLHLRPPPRPARSTRRPFPDWVEYRPNQIWIYDTTHFTRAGVAVTIIEDLVFRKWLAHIVSGEETSTQIEVVFTDALDSEGLLAGVEARADGIVPVDVDDNARPILLAVSDIHTA